MFFSPPKSYSRPRSLHKAGRIWKQHLKLWKRIKCFLVHTTPEKFEITSHPVFGFEDSPGREISHDYREVIVFKFFPSTLTRKADVFMFLPFEERFRKAPFSWQIDADVRSNRKSKKACVFKFLRRRVEWTGPNYQTSALTTTFYFLKKIQNGNVQNWKRAWLFKLFILYDQRIQKELCRNSVYWYALI